jgi:pimeloyl-ACP methyl ester carboxylesterase
MPFINFHEGKIYYHTKGKGRAIILLHGFLGSSQSWKNILPQLSSKYKIITIDLPGFGKSDCFGYVHTMDFMALAVKAVANKLLLRRFMLMGHSMGGYVSLAFAEKFASNVRGLVLCNSTVLPDSEDKVKDRNKAINVVKKNREKYLEEAVKKLFYPPNIKKKPTLLDDVKAIANTTEKQGIIAALEGMKIRKNTEIVLHFSNYPVFFIVGKHDSLIPFQANEFQYKIPPINSTLLLENSGHMCYDEQPTEVANGLISFAKTCFK